MFPRILYRVFAVALLLFALVVCVAAQDLDDVSIAGKITDSAGLAVVGVTVTATSVETGETRTAITNDEGQYRIVKLKPGTYKVRAAQSGFGTQETPGIPTISAQNVQKDFKLAPADIKAQQTITVLDDDGPVIDPTRRIGGQTRVPRRSSRAIFRFRAERLIQTILRSTASITMTTDRRVTGFSPRSNPSPRFR